MSESVLRRAVLTESARPNWVRANPRAPWFVVATVCIGAFMGQLDASIVTVAFPTMQRDFGASLGAVAWVALAYLLVLVATVVAVGRFADMVGRKLLYTYGFAVFTVASIACGLAPTLWVLILCRLVQALGAAMLQANSVALIVTALPVAKLGRGIGVQGAAQAIGLAAGPSIGGLLIAAGGWRWIFFVNVPAGILGLVTGWLLLPRSANLAPRERFDWLGLVLFAPGVAALLAALSLGSQLGFGSAAILGLFAAAAVSGTAFVVHERTTAAPMVDLRLFRSVRFSAGIVSGFLSYAVLFGVLFVVPFLFERGFGLAPGTSGLVLTVLPAALGVVAPVAGRLADGLGAAPLTVTGMLICAAALGAAAMWHDTVGQTAVVLTAVGVGAGLFTSPNNAAVMAGASRRHAGSAGGLLNMTRGIGTAMGVALAGLVFGLGAASGQVARGFGWTVAVLAVLALVAAVLAALPERP